ncbi:MAG TPA: FemAB family XrtA/PEP-CTERM system-associated protein [Gemmatimonadales bacterium]|nr:FemAB family XrtA/PEP-CTERM system-associated protein [Gemmatimonadales bacterium]
MSTEISLWQRTPEEWDRFVRGQPGWTHFHLYAWKDVIERTLGHECLYLAAETAGATTAVLPLVRVRSALFGHFLVSMPFVNYGGPLGDSEAVRALAARACEQARAERVKLLELRSRIPLPLDLAVSHRKITVVLDLPSDPAVLWQALGSKLRSQVKRPQKEGLTVQFGPEQVEPFYAVFAQHMHDLGTPAMPRGFFWAIAERFGETTWFGCVYHGSRPVACGAGFRWGDELELTWASSLTEYNRIAPNMLLYWAFMERAVQHGVTLFNFGRCSPDGGTHRFKRQWGSRDEQLWWYQQAGGHAAGTPSPTDSKYAWGPRLWRRLPLRLATALGPRIVRFIP